MAFGGGAAAPVRSDISASARKMNDVARLGERYGGTPTCRIRTNSSQVKRLVLCGGEPSNDTHASPSGKLTNSGGGAGSSMLSPRCTWGVR